jgi:predicted small secreted protein
MKKISLLIVLTLALTVLAGCHHGLGHQVKGSGNRQKQKREVPSFNSISTEGAFHIEVIAQKAASLEIEADDNILPLISTEVVNNVLVLKPTNTYSVSEPIIIRISVPDLASITANGAGKIDVNDLKNEKFEINLNGAPYITVAGQTKLVNIDTNGAGTINTNRLRAGRAVVDSKGVSKIEVYAADQLDVTVSGPSTVLYAGNPTVNKTIHGPGSVEKRPSTGA